MLAEKTTTSNTIIIRVSFTLLEYLALAALPIAANQHNLSSLLNTNTSTPTGLMGRQGQLKRKAQQTRAHEDVKKYLIRKYKDEGKDIIPNTITEEVTQKQVAQWHKERLDRRVNYLYEKEIEDMRETVFAKYQKQAEDGTLKMTSDEESTSSSVCKVEGLGENPDDTQIDICQDCDKPKANGKETDAYPVRTKTTGFSVMDLTQDDVELSESHITYLKDESWKLIIPDQTSKPKGNAKKDNSKDVKYVFRDPSTYTSQDIVIVPMNYGDMKAFDANLIQLFQKGMKRGDKKTLINCGLSNTDNIIDMEEDEFDQLSKYMSRSVFSRLKLYRDFLFAGGKYTPETTMLEMKQLVENKKTSEYAKNSSNVKIMHPIDKFDETEDNSSEIHFYKQALAENTLSEDTCVDTMNYINVYTKNIANLERLNHVLTPTDKAKLLLQGISKSIHDKFNRILLDVFLNNEQNDEKKIMDTILRFQNYLNFCIENDRKAPFVRHAKRKLEDDKQNEFQKNCDEFHLERDVYRTMPKSAQDAYKKMRNIIRNQNKSSNNFENNQFGRNYNGHSERGRRRRRTKRWAMSSTYN